jgi:hypothetical protein
VADHVDRDAVMRLIDEGQPHGLPLVRGQLDSRTQSGEALPPAYEEASDTTPRALTMPDSDQQRSIS